MLGITVGVEAPDLPKALVLSAGTYFYGEELRAWWRGRTSEAHVPPERRAAAQAVHTALGPDQWRLLAEAFLALHAHAPAEDFPEEEELRSIRAPTLIIHGDRDWFFPVVVPVALYGLIPASELCILPNAGRAHVHSHAD